MNTISTRDRPSEHDSRSIPGNWDGDLLVEITINMAVHFFDPKQPLADRLVMTTIVHHLFSTNEQHSNEIEEGILLGASDLLRNGSAEHIEIEDITSRSKVSQATFYKIFSSVDGLFKKLALNLTNEIVLNFVAHTQEIPNVVNRVAFKSKGALLILSNSKFLSQLLLKAEWPSSNPNHIIYKDIEKDLRDGIKQGCFSDVDPSIGVNIILGCLRGAAVDLLDKKQPEKYMDQVTCQILVSLGVDPQTAELATRNLNLKLPPPPSNGLFYHIISSQRKSD